MKASIFLVFLMTSAAANAADIPSAAAQIDAAVQAAPEARRAEAGVLGYAAGGDLVTLREGKNDLICLADKPGNKSFSVACYHKDLEPFMARGRELAAAGHKGKERHQIRWKDVEDGKVAMAKEPRMLYVLNGSGYDAATKTIADPYLRWVIYVPGATAEETGLTIEPGNEPWLMFPGTPGAHIMISPPKK